MTSADRSPVPPARTHQPLPDHPVRVALLDLLAEVGTVTATGAAGRLGYSSGLCSFHLRQLARYGLIEEAPHPGGRARPWRLRWGDPEPSEQPQPAELTPLAPGLADESYRRWLPQRERAPRQWQRDESLSAVVHLTPAEATELAAAIRELVVRYRGRDEPSSVRPDGAVPVAAIVRIFPLLH